MKTISQIYQHKLEVKKSLFITYLFPIMSEEEAKEKITKIKKEYPDATHWCYGYRVGEIKRFSDNGEPNKTAGMPILAVLEKENLDFILCIVIRYFGGVKLGTGGLVRAYTKSVTELLSKIEYNELKDGIQFDFQFDYNDQKQIDYLLRNAIIEDQGYHEHIFYRCHMSLTSFQEMIDILKNYGKITNQIEKNWKEKIEET